VRVLVELPHIGDNFDRDAYSKFSLESSQLSQPVLTSQPPPNTQTIFENPRKTPKKPFIWDEDTQVIIPDSQDLLGSLSYAPTKASSSLEVVKAPDSRSAAPIEIDRPPPEPSQSLTNPQIRPSETQNHLSFEVSLEATSDSAYTSSSDSCHKANLGILSGNHSTPLAQDSSSQRVEHYPSTQTDKQTEDAQSVACPDIQPSSQNPTSQLSKSSPIEVQAGLHRSPGHVPQSTNNKDVRSNSTESQFLPAHPDGDTPQSVIAR